MTLIYKNSKKFLLLVIFLSMVTGLVFYKIVFISTTISSPSFWSIYGLIATIFLISRLPYAYLHQDDHSKIYPSTSYPNVSIIIPAKNEEDGILRTIKTCINSIYEGQIEIIVIDDGSTDGTKNEVLKAREIYGEKVKLIAFEKNQGKREAMAEGIAKVLYEIIVFVDSDSFISTDSIHHIVEHFMQSEKVAAVSGNTKVENIDQNTLTKMQSIKYAVSFDIYKASESVHSSVTCCPGCFSAYRKSIIKPLIPAWKNHTFLGSKSTFGDDRGLTNFVLRDGWDIVYCEKAQATTVVPHKFSVYWKQQLRWKKSWIREGIFASTFMWKMRHPLASFAFYTTFSFPFLVIPLVFHMINQSRIAHNPMIMVVFLFGFLLLGMVFALFTRVYKEAYYWLYMPLISLTFITMFIWQMPYALLTFKKTQWGTR